MTVVHTTKPASVSGKEFCSYELDIYWVSYAGRNEGSHEKLVLIRDSNNTPPECKSDSLH
jgi:hypothetical protein